jgi:membrane protease YdiL (CAAX protease family)
MDCIQHGFYVARGRPPRHWEKGSQAAIYQAIALARAADLFMVGAMRPLRALGIYLVAVFLGGALLAPCLYWLAQSMAGTFPHLAESPFHRFVNRAVLVLALVGIWPLLRSLGARSCRDLGLVTIRGHWPRLGAGLALGFASLALVAAAALLAGARVTSPHAWQASLVTKLLGAALTALVVAVLEEILFRGALFGSFRRAMSWPAALLLSSSIYAIVHFMQSAKLEGTVTWHSGLEVLPRMLQGFADLHQIVPGFFNLTLAGALLAYAYQRTGNLWFSIGLHAGWIFWLKSYGILTREAAGANTWFWGTSRLINGWFALFVLAVALVVLRRQLGPPIHNASPEAPEPT